MLVAALATITLGVAGCAASSGPSVRSVNQAELDQACPFLTHDSAFNRLEAGVLRPGWLCAVVPLGVTGELGGARVYVRLLESKPGGSGPEGGFPVVLVREGAEYKQALAPRDAPHYASDVKWLFPKSLYDAALTGRGVDPSAAVAHLREQQRRRA